MSTAVSSQLSLWEVPQPHHHMEIIWLSGYRKVFCTASPDYPACTERPGDRQWEAGFVGFAASADECSICNPVLKK